MFDWKRVTMNQYNEPCLKKKKNYNNSKPNFSIIILLIANTACRVLIFLTGKAVHAQKNYCKFSFAQNAGLAKNANCLTGH